VIFDEAMELTRTIGSNASYEDEALRMLWHAASGLPIGSVIVETGCEYGRSTSLLAQLAKSRSYQPLHLIDPFYTYEGTPVLSLVGMLFKVGAPYHLHVMTTAQAYSRLPLLINLVHIDGDHTAEGVEIDCDLLLPRVIYGGYAVFHDYGLDSLPEVKPVVDRFIKSWRKVGIKGSCLVVRKS